MDKEKLQTKFANFWYYYKWYVVCGAVLLASLIVGVHSCANRINPDLHVLFAVERSANSYLIKETEEWLGSLTEDVNGDGETTARVIATATMDQWKGSNTAAMVVQANAGDAILYILTDGTYAILHENGVLQSLSGESPYLEGDRYNLTASGALKEMPTYEGEEENYYLCIRKVEGTTYAEDEAYLTQERLAKELLKKLIAAE